VENEKIKEKLQKETQVSLKRKKGDFFLKGRNQKSCIIELQQEKKEKKKKLTLLVIVQGVC
jgi:hypothetical protein